MVPPDLVCLSDSKPSMRSATSYQPVERRKVYAQIAEQLIGQIGSRRLKPGDVLPPERELTQIGRAHV